ncbi:unnamed protein product, partial [Candidula unifasciata]
NTFHGDAAAFVLEMDKCLQKEKELLFTYQEEQTETEMVQHTEDIIGQAEDADIITQIERLTQEVNSKLLQTKRLNEELERYFSVTAELMASLTQGNVNPDSLGDEDSEEIGHYSAELQNLHMNHEQTTSQIVTCKQSAVIGMSQLSLLCLHFSEKLIQDLQAWKMAEAKRSVKVGPKTNTGALLNKAKRFGDAVNTVFGWFSDDGVIQSIREAEQIQSPNLGEFFLEVGRIQMEFQRILCSFIQIIVTAQPKGVVSIENKGKKDSPNYCTKKTQPFSSIIRVLAAESFPSFHILSKKVELVAEKDLAQGSNAEVVGKDGQSCLKVEASTGNTLPEIQFNIEVKNFCRVEQNNVYKQFFRLLYKVKVSVRGTEYILETMSLPFTFNTGANQILEHMGARMWYCASVEDLYNSGFQCPDPLYTDEVINILENRIAYIGNKTRRLTAQEKTFLRGRLPVASDGTVTMQGFLKDKMKTLRSEEPLNYSFYTWFYSVIHTLEQLLLNAWQDGIIYGFCSEKTAELLLMSPDVPEGTFLLRPSVSEIKKTSSADATAALVMEVKLRKGSAHPFDGHSSEFEVTSVPLFYKHIEKNTLYGAIKGIECNNKPVARFLYGKKGGRKLEVLKGYVKKQEEKFFPEYRMLIEKIEKINIRHCNAPTAATEVVSDRDDDSGQEPTKRKRRYRKSSPNTQIPSNSQSPLSSGATCGSPSGCATSISSGEITLSFGDIKQENPPHMQFQSGGAVNEQSQRSGMQGKTIAGTTHEDSVVGNIRQEENGLLGREVEFGTLKVDVSHIDLTTVSHTSPQDFSSAANGSGFTEMDITNSLPRHVHYNTQRQENQMNNCFISSVSSPAYNGGCSSDQSTLDTNFSMHNFTSASMTSAFPSSPGNMQMSQPSVDIHLLPTVVNDDDAKECKKQACRQGGSKGKIQNSNVKKHRSSSRSTIKPVVMIPNGGQSSSTSFEVTPVSLLNQICTVYADAESYIVDLPMDSSLNQDNTLNIGGIDAAQLFESMLQQRATILQLSPDSGVGDQSPSPQSIWKSHPLSSVFQNGSDILDTTDLSHV